MLKAGVTTICVFSEIIMEEHTSWYISNTQINPHISNLMGKRELVTLLSLSSWCLVIAVWLFFAVPWDCLQFVVVVFPGHAHLLFLVIMNTQLMLK